MTDDIQIIRGFNQNTPSTVAYTPGMALRGTAKAVQKFSVLFLREYDAIRNRGTNFIPLLKTGQIRTSNQVQLQFTIAATKIFGQLGDQTALPEAEQIGGVSLIANSIFSDNLTLTVSLQTGDGTVNFVLPVSTQ